MSPKARGRYEAAAREWKDHKAKELEEAEEAVSDVLAMARVKQQETSLKAGTLPLILSSCALTPAAWD
eukprot:7889618-Lingulodinium_polyedra.AAC.1